MPRPSHYDKHRTYILSALRNAAARHSRPPTVRELAFELAVSGSTVHSYLNQMAEEGLITWQSRSHRSVRLTLKAFQELQQQAAPQP